MPPDLTGKVIAVTGANSGIGKVTARGLAGMGATVVMVCRSQERGEAALADIKASTGSPDVHLMLCDLSSQADIRRFADEFKAGFDRLDVLVNNAGGFYMSRRESVDGLELTFAINYMAPFLLTHLLLDLLKASAPSRIVNVSSDMHRSVRVDFDDLQRHRRYNLAVYGEAKSLLVMYTYELARRLEGTGVTVNALHPGFVRTDFGKNNGFLARAFLPVIHVFAVSEEKGAETSIYLASSLEVEGVTGEYFISKQAVPSGVPTYDEALQKRAWEIGEASVLEGTVRHPH